MRIDQTFTINHHNFGLEEAAKHPGQKQGDTGLSLQQQDGDSTLAVDVHGIVINKVRSVPPTTMSLSTPGAIPRPQNPDLAQGQLVCSLTNKQLMNNLITLESVLGLCEFYYPLLWKFLESVFCM